MALVTRTLTNAGAPLYSPDGDLLVGVKIHFRLMDMGGRPSDALDATTNQQVGGDVIVATTDTAGEFSVDLWPNTRGNRATKYKCRVQFDGFREFSGIVEDVPGFDLQWVDFMLGGAAMEPQEISQLAQYLQDIDAAREAAEAAELGAQGSESAASGSALSAETARDVAQGYASAASGYADAASGSKAAALASEGTATAKAGEAAASAITAASARDAALIQAGVYTTEALGRAAVADGQAFKVQGSGDVAAYEYRRIDASTSVPIASYPSVASVKKVASITGYATPAAGVDAASGVAAGEYFWVRPSTGAAEISLWQNVAGQAVDTGVKQTTTQSTTASAATLLGSEAQGFALDATTDLVHQAVKVLDTTTPANNYTGALDGFLEANIFSQPKMVVLADGSMAFTPNNILKYSENFTSWTHPYATVGAQDADGYSLITTANTGGSYISHPAGMSAVDMPINAYYTVNIRFKPGTASFICVDFQNPSATLSRTWFDLTGLAIGTVGSGITPSMHTTDVDGQQLPAGEYRISLRRKVTASGGNLLIYPCDADGSVASTNGKTLYLRSAQLSVGLAVTGYVYTNSAKRTGAPYDWSRGGRRLLSELQVATFYSLHSEDLTQAAWVKVNGTPALDQTGPFGEPCSSFTATASDATCLQSVTAAVTTAYAQFRIKRIIGTGTVSITADNGATWKDVTASVNGAGFVLAYCRATAANPTFGIKLGTSGDSVAVSLAEISSICSSPLPIYAVARTRLADFFRIPLTKLPAFTSATLFVDFELAAEYDQIGAGGGALGFGNLSGVEDYHSIGRYSNNSNIARTSRLSNATYSQNYAADFPSNLRVEGSMRVEPGGVTHSINGMGEVYDNRCNVGTLAYVKAYGDEPVYVRRILMIPRALADDEMAHWKYSGDGSDPRYVADAMVDKFGAHVGANNVREPSVEVISDTPTSAIIAVAYVNRNNTSISGHVELPMRLMWRKFSFDKATQALSPLSASTVLVEQDNWAAGLGHTQGGKLIKIKHGEYKGRLLLIYTQLISANGMLTPTDWRVLYCKYSDDNGVTWSTPTIIKDLGSGTYVITSGGDYVQFPAGGPYSGRIVFPYYGSSGLWALYSDDFGVTWSQSNSMATATEPMLTLRPDGKTLVMMSREGGYGISTDGGQTFTTVVAIPGYTAIGVGMSNVENDPDGYAGRLGELLMIGTRNATPNRSQLTIERLDGEALTLSGVRFEPLGRWRGAGYVSAKRLSGGFIAIGYESSVVNSVNLQCDIRLMIIKPDMT